MIRTLSFAGAVLLLAGFAIADAQAQNTKKKNPQCVPNFLAACQERCVKAAGQARYCPQYCEKRQKELGC